MAKVLNEHFFEIILGTSPVIASPQRGLAMTGKESTLFPFKNYPARDNSSST